MTITLVPDPVFKGKGDPPQIVRTWAMRKLYESGMSVGDVARYYGLPYAAAYRAINPERAPATKSKAKPLAALGDLRLAKKSALVRIATAKNASMQDPKVAAVVEELDRRDPAWFEKLR